MGDRVSEDVGWSGWMGRPTSENFAKYRREVREIFEFEYFPANRAYSTKTVKRTRYILFRKVLYSYN